MSLRDAAYAISSKALLSSPDVQYQEKVSEGGRLHGTWVIQKAYALCAFIRIYYKLGFTFINGIIWTLLSTGAAIYTLFTNFISHLCLSL